MTTPIVALCWLPFIYLGEDIQDTSSPSFGVVLTAHHRVFGAPYVLLLSLSTANVAGYTKRALSSGVIFLGYNVGNIAGPYLVDTTTITEHLPRIWIGIIVSMCIASACSLALRFHMMRENAIRDRETALPNTFENNSHVEDEGGEKSDPDGKRDGTPLGNEDAEKSAFKDLTDVENRAFRYSL